MGTRRELHPLVQTDWLAEHLGDSDLRIVDARWRPRYEQGRGVSTDDRAGYLAGHIPGAVFVGMVSDLSDPGHPVPDMLAPPEQFARVMGRLGISNDTLVVAYGDLGPPVAPARLWWALSYYGHDRVQVLDGGLRKWRAEGRPLSTDVSAPPTTVFTARPRPNWIAKKEDVVKALGRPGAVVVDCLSSAMYGSTENHPWGERPGHIPGAVNVSALANIDPTMVLASAEDYQRVWASDQGLTYASRDALAALYKSAGVPPHLEVITYCGRGYGAACGLLALKALGYERVRLYDGSWAEWSADPDLPIEIAPAPAGQPRANS